MEITLERLKIIAGREGFNIVMIEKDYLVTYLLYLIKDLEGIYFKGGTALHKIILDHKRLSEDLDFTLTRGVKEVEEDIKSAIKGSIFEKITHGKETDNFTRLIVYYKLFHEEGKIFLDLNKRGKLILKPRLYEISHFYEDIIPRFSVNCMDEEEILAEKVCASATRYRARDYADLYFIIKENKSINMPLVEKKFKVENKKFNRIDIFKNTNKVYKSWDKDLNQILKIHLDFKEVMKVISDYFDLKMEKEKLKMKKN